MSASGGKPDIAYARICTGEMVNGTFVSETSVSQVSDVKLAGVRLGACGCKDQVLARFGPQRVSNTLKQESTPSSTIELAASTKKFAALAPWVDIHQPPMAMNRSRALCASTGPSTLAAPCEEKYIDSASPMNAYIGAAVDKYSLLAALTL